MGKPLAPFQLEDAVESFLAFPKELQTEETLLQQEQPEMQTASLLRAPSVVK